MMSKKIGSSAWKSRKRSSSRIRKVNSITYDSYTDRAFIRVGKGKYAYRELKLDKRNA